jgi:hypothetical protein
MIADHKLLAEHDAGGIVPRHKVRPSGVEGACERLHDDGTNFIGCEIDFAADDKPLIS